MAVVVAVGAFWMTLLGGAVAHRVGDRRHLVLGFAAGLMLGAVGFDLLPEALRAQPADVLGVPAPLLLFVGGFLALHTLERTAAVHRAHQGEYAAHTRAHRHDRAPPQALGIAAAGALIAHSVMDGFAIGAAFQAGTGVGTVVALAVVAHDFADGFNTYTVTWLYGNDRRRTFALLGCDAVAPVVGATTTLAFTIPRGVLGLYLGCFAGFLCYLATCDILPEAHSPHPSLATLLCTLGGTGFMWLAIAVAG